MSNKTMEMTAGRLRATVAPHAGGSLASFDAGNHALMRKAPNPASTDPLTMACYPLLPFVGRVAYGHFRFEGREVELPPHPISTPHALHGIGWQRPWTIVSATPHEVTIALTHDGASEGWPWSFEARQTFTLDEKSLSHSLTLTNRATSNMPCGLGVHPFFPNRQGARMKGELPMIWESSSLGLPTNCIDVVATRNFSGGRRIAPLTLDHCFSGGRGPIDINWDDTDLGIRIHGREADHTVVYTPQAHEFFCVEPVTIVPNAFNRQEGANVTGLRVLAPNEAMSLNVRYEVTGV
ncbi:MAG: aldose 1-epimerase [Parvibaculaceae bacterium]